MKILAIETAGKVCGVSVLEDNTLIKEAIVEDENTHSIKLMPLIDKVLKESNVDIREIDLFACDKGPGSFTGIRIGIATIKAFADVNHKQVIGITSLENLACYEKGAKLICTMLDAKNDNVYYGIFQNCGGTYRSVLPLGFANINEVIEILKNQKDSITLVGDGAIAHREILQQKLQEGVTVKQESKLSATHIAKLAFLKKEEATDTNHLMPTYLRKSNAERMLEDKNKEEE